MSDDLDLQLFRAGETILAIGTVLLLISSLRKVL